MHRSMYNFVKSMGIRAEEYDPEVEYVIPRGEFFTIFKNQPRRIQIAASYLAQARECGNMVQLDPGLQGRAFSLSSNPAVLQAFEILVGSGAPLFSEVRDIRGSRTWNGAVEGLSWAAQEGPLDLTGWRFEGGDLKFLDAQGVIFDETSFRGVDLDGADFRGALLTGASFEDCRGEWLT